MNFKRLFSTLLFTFYTAFAATPFNAEGAAYAPGDLMLYFFQEGGQKTVLANLGAATGFRGSVAGPSDAVKNLNVLDLKSALSQAFGQNWASLDNLYAGLVAANNADTSLTTAAVNGDSNRTLYFSAPNNLADEVLGRNIPGNSPMTILATQIAAQGSTFTGTDDFLISPADAANQIMSQNKFLTSGILGQAYGGFSGGIAQVGTAGTYGSAGAVSNVEFALDLHRMLATTQAANTINGVDADGNAIATRTSMYEGTITIDSNGVVGFQAVPEPSSVMLLGLGAGALAFRRRRSA